MLAISESASGSELFQQACQRRLWLCRKINECQPALIDDIPLALYHLLTAKNGGPHDPA